VVCCVIDRVDTNGVQAKLLEFGDVTRAGRRIGQRVDELGGSTRLIIDTTDIESVGSLEESWLMLVDE
jgi:hypothetical protein